MLPNCHTASAWFFANYKTNTTALSYAMAVTVEKSIRRHRYGFARNDCTGALERMGGKGGGRDRDGVCRVRWCAAAPVTKRESGAPSITLTNCHFYIFLTGYCLKSHQAIPVVPGTGEYGTPSEN